VTTIGDVARAAGVSTATVSRVLNDHPRVNPDLAARVRKTMRDLSYQPSGAARTLRTRQSRVWSLVLSDIRNPFFTDMVRGIEDVAYGAGYSIILCNAEEDPAKEAAYIRLALAEQVSGIILVPAHFEMGDLTAAKKQGVPVVTVDRRSSAGDLDSVLVDNVAGASAAVTHLIDNGYRRIACITGPLTTTTGGDRLHGYRRALAKSSVPVDPAFVRTSNFKEAGGYEQMLALVALDPSPDAVFVANGLMTIGALRAIADSGLAIPDDMAIVGFDDMSWAKLIHPPLTAVAQPTYDLGLETGRLLLSRLQGYHGAARQVVLSPTLQVRGSCTPKTVA
jgi:LacI family transcriptional regulator